MRRREVTFLLYQQNARPKGLVIFSHKTNSAFARYQEALCRLLLRACDVLLHATAYIAWEFDQEQCSVTRLEERGNNIRFPAECRIFLPFKVSRPALGFHPAAYSAILDDWLVVHHSITLVDVQLDAKNSYLFIYNTFIYI